MKQLHHIKVGVRLATGFGLVLVLLALFSIAGIHRMHAIQAETQGIIEQDYARIRLLNTMRDAVRYQSVALRDVVLQQDLSFMPTEVKHIKAARERYQAAAEELVVPTGDDRFSKFLSTILFTNVASAANDVGDAAQSMRCVAEDANSGIRRQETEITQIATAMNQMSASAQYVLTNATQAATAAQQAQEESSSGSSIVKETAQYIKDLADEVERTGTALNTLQSNTSDIGVVLDVIKGIAEQTNLLALNAAIEAARDGEQGRGFSVVADEVLTLASKTQESTQEIESMIERLQNGAANAVSVMQSSQERAQNSVSHAARAAASLEQIAQAVETISNMNIQIATAANEQSSVADSINQSISRISHVAEESAKRSDNTTDAGKRLETLAEELRTAMGGFHT